MRQKGAKGVRFIDGKDNAYCTCYDCIAELRILREYAKLANKNFNSVVQAFGVSLNRQRRVTFQNVPNPSTRKSLIALRHV